MNTSPKFNANDLVAFKFSARYKETYNGVIVSIWRKNTNKIVYEVASMNHSMCSYSISEECIVKKLS